MFFKDSFFVSKIKSKLMPKRGDTKGHHNEGQTDASEGKYDPPHERPFGFYDDKEIADRDAYKEGWRHAKDQD